MKKSLSHSCFYFAGIFLSRNKIGLMIFLSCAITLTTNAQQKKFNFPLAHAHNDYLQPFPFYTAYNAGFGSIEADIFPVNGVLCVAHNEDEIRPKLTLKSLYIDPILKELGLDKSRHLKLLIDIKKDSLLSLELLIKEIKPLVPFLSTTRENKQLIILISGKRPPPRDYNDYPGYIFFDDDMKLTHNAVEWERVGQVSLQFSRYSDWKGDNSNEPGREDIKRLEAVVDSIHRAGKTVRFWGAPDNEMSWTLQVKIAVDLIGTDKIEDLAAFLRKRSQ